MRKNELVSWAIEVIKIYYAAEKELILTDSNCCHSDSLQALADECHAIFNGFIKLLE